MTIHTHTTTVITITTIKEKKAMIMNMSKIGNT